MGTIHQYASQAMRTTADGQAPSLAVWIFVGLLAIALVALAYKAKPKPPPAEEERKTRLK